MRLENSFRDNRVVLDALALAYGERLAGIVLALATVMAAVARHRSLHTAPGEPAPDALSPYLYDQMVKGALRFLERGRQEGEIKAPAAAALIPNPHFGPQPELEAFLARRAALDAEPGVPIADGVIAQLVDATSWPTGSPETAKAVRAFLGDDFVGRLARTPAAPGPLMIPIRGVREEPAQ